ncbi:hypothetical protein MFUCSW5_430099 [Mariniflexile fucanivorans]
MVAMPSPLPKKEELVSPDIEPNMDPKYLSNKTPSTPPSNSLAPSNRTIKASKGVLKILKFDNSVKIKTVPIVPKTTFDIFFGLRETPIKKNTRDRTVEKNKVRLIEKGIAATEQTVDNIKINLETIPGLYQKYKTKQINTP